MTAVASYEAVTYDAKPIPQAHPDRIGTLVRLTGLAAAAAERCRVLDVGCADGTHLLGLAYEYPASEFVGIDASERQIALAQVAARELGLENVSFHCADLALLDLGKERFDYVSAHGFYSWVALAVREQLFARLRDCLAPSGVGYLSYAVYPGAASRMAVRNAIMPLLAGVAPDLMPARFRTLARAFAEGIAPEQPSLAALKAEFGRAAVATDSAVVHDWCEDTNEPVYFRTLARQLSEHGLRYLCETSLLATSPGRLSPAARQALGEIGSDPIEREQAFDILTCNGFRRSLVVRAGAPPPTPSPDPVALRGCYWGSSALLDGDRELKSRGILTLKNTDGATAQLGDPLGKAVAMLLVETWPGLMTFDDLAAVARARLRDAGLKSELSDAALLKLLLELYSAAFIDVRSTLPPCTASPGEKPRASELARWQSRRCQSISNQHHFPVNIPDQRALSLLGLLDGERDHQALLRDWRAAANADVSSADLDSHLRRFAKLGLLVA